MLQKTTCTVKPARCKKHPAQNPACQNTDMTKDNSLGTRIKSLREQAKLDQAVLAEAVGTARSHLTNIERGRAKPGRELLLAIAKYFSVSVDWLANGSEDKILMQPISPKEMMLLDSFRKLPKHEAELHFSLIVSRASGEKNDEN
jgi:transcriptional regulator with XRE-family HTH domain